MNTDPSTDPGTGTGIGSEAGLEGDRVKVLALIGIGDDVELTTPDHPAAAPLRLPKSVVARDADLPESEVVGRRYTAVRSEDGTYSDFRLVHDPRL